MNALPILLLSAAFSVLTFKATHGEEIIHGKKAKYDSLQYMVSVQLDKKHLCGGFLIDASYVLTAAHCDKPGYISVVVGTQNINPNGKNLKRHAVKSKHKLSSYRCYGSDIMLLKLSTKVRLDKHVKLIKIPSKNKPVKPNTKCLVAGWGKTEAQNTVNDLLVADVSTINP